MTTHSKSTCLNDALLEDDDVDVREGVFYRWLLSSPPRLRPESGCPRRCWERQATVSREGYELLYVERSQEGPPQRLKNDDSNELSPEAFQEALYSVVYKGSHVTSQLYSLFIMPARKKTRRRRRRQRGGILPLAALIPALIAGGKAVALGAAGGAAGFGAKKALQAITRKKPRRARTAADMEMSDTTSASRGRQ